jgi:sterol desaturase/sphingolipid hydroxylase (fatty acid hydroxylase superfamily)
MDIQKDISAFIHWAWTKVINVTGYDNFELKSVGYFLLLPLVCLVLEAILLGWKKSSLYILFTRFKEVQNDVFCFAIHAAGLYNLIGILFTFGIFYWAFGFFQKYGSLHIIDKIESGFLQFAIMLFVGDFKNYIRHWLFHKWGWAWRLHQFHHSASEFTMLTYLRSHAAEVALTNILDLFPFIIFGANFQAFAAVYVVREAHQYFIHSQLKSDWGLIGKYLLVSPLAHRIHHSTNENFHGKNLGNTFIIWDRLFGTYAETNADNVAEIGLPENPYNKESFIQEYWLCYKNAINDIFAPLFFNKR